jgi:hypothetical protein
MDQAFIEQIVAEVMSRLVTDDEPAPEAKTETLNSQPSTINVREAIITGDLLSENVNGHGVVQIAPKAILTPSAQDWLRNRKVEVVRGETKTQTASSARWLAVVHSGSEAVSSALDDAGRVVSVKTESVETAAEAARRAVLDLRSGDAHGVIAFSNEAEAVACLANRESCCRAAAVRTVADVRRVQNSMGCNLFAVDASGLGFFELRNLLKCAFSGGAPKAPAGWK